MPTVLIVEDEWVIADALTAALTDAGYRVLTAANGRIALELLAELRPDVILLDFMMPIMNGRRRWTPSTRIRSFETFPSSL
jgi:CheY-like chemotaxis protein